MQSNPRRARLASQHLDTLMYVRVDEVAKARALLAFEPGPPIPVDRGEGGATPGAPSRHPALALADAPHGVTTLPRSPEVRARLRVLVGLLWLTGCRISEALKVRECDLDAAGGFLVLRNLKQAGAHRGRGATKALPLPPGFVEELVAIGPAMADGQLFPWSRPHAYVLVRAALEAAGVEAERAHPHALRHGHAIHALRGGATLDVVQRALGHAQVGTTAKYLRATGEDVRRAYAGIKW